MGEIFKIIVRYSREASLKVIKVKKRNKKICWRWNSNWERKWIIWRIRTNWYFFRLISIYEENPRAIINSNKGYCKHQKVPIQWKHILEICKWARKKRNFKKSEIFRRNSESFVCCTDSRRLSGSLLDWKIINSIIRILWYHHKGLSDCSFEYAVWWSWLVALRSFQTSYKKRRIAFYN